MSTPICHRTLVATFTAPAETSGDPCLGSRCSLWISQYAEIKGDGSPEQGGFNRMEPTGMGGCADNPKRSWADPAAEVEGA